MLWYLVITNDIVLRIAIGRELVSTLRARVARDVPGLSGRIEVSAT